MKQPSKYQINKQNIIKSKIINKNKPVYSSSTFIYNQISPNVKQKFILQYIFFRLITNKPTTIIVNKNKLKNYKTWIYHSQILKKIEVKMITQKNMPWTTNVFNINCIKNKMLCKIEIKNIEQLPINEILANKSNLGIKNLLKTKIELRILLICKKWHQAETKIRQQFYFDI